MRFLEKHWLSLYAIALGFLTGIVEPAPKGHFFVMPSEMTWEIAAPGIVLAVMAWLLSLFFTRMFMGKVEGGVIITSNGIGVYLPWKTRK